MPFTLLKWKPITWVELKVISLLSYAYLCPLTFCAIGGRTWIYKGKIITINKSKDKIYTNDKGHQHISSRIKHKYIYCWRDTSNADKTKINILYHLLHIKPSIFQQKHLLIFAKVIILFQIDIWRVNDADFIVLIVFDRHLFSCFQFQL